jgi:hypothetical protein
MLKISGPLRLILATCPSAQDRFMLARAALRELREPGSKKEAFLYDKKQWRNVLRYIFMVGIIREPKLYLFGPVVAFFCTAYLISILITSLLK